MSDNDHPSGEQRLGEIRTRIDTIDRQLLKLINERARCADEVGEVKRRQGSATAFYRPEREAQVLRRLSEENPGPLDDEEVKRLFREIMSACLARERQMRIAYLGPAGTFTQAAALKHFGHSVKTLPFGAIDEIFREVEAGGVDYGVVPVENSTEGVVSHTLDMFVRSELKICGEVVLRIHHHLCGKGELGQIERVYSHRQSLAQTREWLDANLSGIAREEVSSNGEAARRAADERGAAAICGRAAAELYELNLLACNIEDEPNNTTRFLIIGPRSAGVSGEDKSSLLLAARNEPGALYHLLRPLAEADISMTRIESRPSRQVVWEYLFFVDIEGHAEQPEIAQALDELKSGARLYKWLGSYPRAVLAATPPTGGC